MAHIAKRPLGEPKKAITLRSENVVRKEKLFIPEWRKWVPVTHYDNHFIYESKKMGQPAYMCTCGGPAVVALPSNPEPKKMFITRPKQQPVFVCLLHATNGKHGTGQT